MLQEPGPIVQTARGADRASGTANGFSKTGTWELGTVVLASVGFSVWWALDQQKGISWDQKNYHFYNVYAWLNGKMDYHIAPAGQHSWLNPLGYVPQYWMTDHLSPQMTGAIFGAWAGLNLVLVYTLARLVLTRAPRALAAFLALACVVVGFADPSFLGMTGTSDIDHVVSLPVLGALCALCWAAQPPRSERQILGSYAIAGGLLGAAAGLKWTCFVYAVAMTFTLLILWRILRMNGRKFGVFAAGGILGFLPTGGYWSWLLWTRYGNPVLPYWNDVFHSPWMPQSRFHDERFLPKSLEHAITYPFQFFLGGDLHPTAEGPFRDARFAVLAVLVPLVAAVALGVAARRFLRTLDSHQEGASCRDARWLVFVFFLLSYSLWLKMFAIHRYLAPLTFLTGLVALVCIDYLVSSRASLLAAFLLVASFSTYWTRVELTGWRVAYGETWFGLRMPAVLQEPNALIVMIGGGPMGHVVPYLPESARVVRLINSTIPQDGTPTELGSRADLAIRDHQGLIRSLSMEPLQAPDYAYLQRFGLGMDQESCVSFSSDVDKFTTCALIRQPAGR